MVGCRLKRRLNFRFRVVSQPGHSALIEATGPSQRKKVLVVSMLPIGRHVAQIIVRNNF